MFHITVFTKLLLWVPEKFVEFVEHKANALLLRVRINAKSANHILNLELVCVNYY